MCITKEQLFEITSPDPNDLPEFEIEVWYRFVAKGNQEKDFDTYKIKALTLPDAILKASKLYGNNRRIPFAFIHKGEKFGLSQLDEIRTEKTAFEKLNPTCKEITGGVSSNTTNQKNPDFDKPLSDLNNEY